MQSTRQEKTLSEPKQSIAIVNGKKMLEDTKNTQLAPKDVLAAADSLINAIEEDIRLIEKFTIPALKQHNAVLEARIKLLKQCETVETSITAFQEQMLAFNQKYSNETLKLDPKDIEAIKTAITSVDNEIKTLDEDKKDYAAKYSAHTKLNSNEVSLTFKKLDFSLVATHKLIQAIQIKKMFRTDKALKETKTKMEELYNELSAEIPEHIETYNSSIKFVPGYSDAMNAYKEAQKKAAEGFNDLPFVQITKKQMAAEQPRTRPATSATHSSATNRNCLLSPKGHQAPQAAKIDQNKLGAAPGRGLS